MFEKKSGLIVKRCKTKYFKYIFLQLQFRSNFDKCNVEIFSTFLNMFGLSSEMQYIRIEHLI